MLIIQANKKGFTVVTQMPVELQTQIQSGQRVL